MDIAPPDGVRRSSRRRRSALIWPIIAVVLAQAAIASLSIHAVSIVRAYVGGESFWSKGLKDAIHNIDLYARTGDESAFLRYETAIAIPFADRAGRLALEQPVPDLAAARRGFVGGGNHADDIEGLIWAYRFFRDFSYLREAIERWRAADPKLLELSELAQSIRAERRQGGAFVHTLVPEWRAAIIRLDDELSILSREFSMALGRGSRAITGLLIAANLFTAAALILLAVWRTRRLMAQRQAYASALDAERERAITTLSSIGQAVISTDARGGIDYANPVAEQLLGKRLIWLKGRTLGDACRLVGEGGEACEDVIVARALAGKESDAGRIPFLLMRRDGTHVPVSVTVAPIQTAGKVTGSVVVVHDTSRERDLIDRLSWQAMHDELTGLLNRRAFETRLGEAIEEAAPPSVSAILFIDLDQFKIVNDTCGHAAGDALLQEVTIVIRRQLEEGDMLARLGGDEFGILLGPGLPARSAAIAVRLRDAVSELVFAWNGRPFAISASIGVVELRPGATREEILRDADLACYMAKEKGRNRVQVHQASDTEFQERVGEMAWVQRIRAALDDNRFVLFGQPIAALGGSETGGHLEVLLRLRDEDGGLVAPSAFLPPAERYGLMPMLDRWVVRNVLDRIARIEPPERQRLATCAINLSGATFADTTFVDFVKERFEATGVSPSLICFEITETSAIAKLSTANCFISTMKALGCRFSLDDFGSGMSSFAYLKHLPVDYLKIDGGFVKDMLDDRIDRAMVEMIHHIGKVTGKSTIAEFVETVRVAEALRAIGVDYAQGYGIAAPEPFDAAWRRACDLAAQSAVDGEPAEEPLRKAG